MTPSSIEPPEPPARSRPAPFITTRFVPAVAVLLAASSAMWLTGRLLRLEAVSAAAAAALAIGSAGASGVAISAAQAGDPVASCAEGELVGADATDDDVLWLAGCLAAAGADPITVPIASAARARFGPLAIVHRFTAIEGAGARGTVGGHQVVLGHQAYLAAAGMAVPTTLRADAADAADTGHTALFAGWGGSARAVLVVAHSPRATRAGGTDTDHEASRGNAARRNVVWAALTGIVAVIAGTTTSTSPWITAGLPAAGLAWLAIDADRLRRRASPSRADRAPATEQTSTTNQEQHP